ncbi:phosphoribosylanthranilate isomerase [Virgibacillus sp. C22-A2]|uniref:N-(5'-phosphoribosyl)anthranilate isomerase n=1 Tax=Virgibacillus tibetensis TaxID=3042313 RepID=A0ABU6KJI7_9BACI|nr:phosphoribosylanthranilate isomerase [Virgibacillus sp. C22-A2]
MLVKICGIKTKQAAQTAANAGADLIGFVFAPSKRRISPSDAAIIAKSLPASSKTVGVFVNESVERMMEIANLVGLDYIQLHGDEPAAIAQQLDYKIIKAFPVQQDNLSEIKAYPCDFYLLDSPAGVNRGGNGTTFDWHLTRNLSLDPAKIILAGGLTVENVNQASKLVNPAGVDVSSGVEVNGEKDLVKIKEFIESAKKSRKDETIENLHNA